MKRRDVIELDPQDWWEVTVIDPDSVVTAPIPRLNDEPVSHQRPPSWLRVNWFKALFVFTVAFFIALDTFAYLSR